MQHHYLNKNKIFLYLSFYIGLMVFPACSKVEAERDWQNINTVEDLWNVHPSQIRSLFEAIDLKRQELKQVANLLSNGDTVGGAKALLEFYRKTDRNWIITTLDSISPKEAIQQANSLLVDSVIRQGKVFHIPKNPDNGWQWNYTGPDNDDEFGYGLNGNKFLPALYSAWKNTGNPKYVAVYDRLVKDWILHHPLPTAGDSIYMVLDTTIAIDYRDIGEVEWRTLEAGHRLGASWPQTFYAFQQAEEFSPASRLLMLSSISQQGAYLRKYHKYGHNWTTMEMNGLALAGLSFPEFKASEDWANYALNIMTEEINRQVYPDGVQTEVSSKTQWVALKRFESVADNFQKANRSLEESYIKRLEEMYEYLAYSMRPDGHQPLNNDSDRDDLKSRILAAAIKFDRPDWEWIATNGKSGILPEIQPTVTFPWAGIHIMRNGWHQNAQWSFFDVGPYGTGHQHRDMLHLSVHAFGKDLLVDGGRYTHKDYFNFDPAFWRGYFRSSFSHNVILVDNKGQKPGPLRMKSPLLENKDYLRHDLYDYASGTFGNGYETIEGEAEHTRSVLYIRNKYWLVLDHFKTDRPRKLQVLWHYAPDYDVILEGNEAVSINENEANLRIVPIGDTQWETEIIKGQEKPFIQGWYSAEFGVKVPNPTIVYTTEISGSTTFAWLLVPAKEMVPKIKAEIQITGSIATLSIEKNGDTRVHISLPIEKNPSKVQIKFLKN